MSCDAAVVALIVFQMQIEALESEHREEMGHLRAKYSRFAVALKDYHTRLLRAMQTGSVIGSLSSQASLSAPVSVAVM